MCSSRKRGGKNRYRKKLSLSCQGLTACTKLITNIISWKTVYFLKTGRVPNCLSQQWEVLLSSGVLSPGSSVYPQWCENTAAKGTDSTKICILILLYELTQRKSVFIVITKVWKRIISKLKNGFWSYSPNYT